MNYKITQKSEAPSFDLPKKSNFKRILAIIYPLVAITAIINLVGTNALATRGVILDGTLSKIVEIEKENKLLRLEIAKMSTLSYIENKAVELGYKRVKSNLTIMEDQTVAEVQR